MARDLGIPFLMLDQTGEMLIEPDGRRISMHYFTPDLNSRDTYLGKQIASKGAKKVLSCRGTYQRLRVSTSISFQVTSRKKSKPIGNIKS